MLFKRESNQFTRAGLIFYHESVYATERCGSRAVERRLINDRFPFSATLRLHVSFNGAHRQANSEGSALAFALTLDHHTATVKFDQMLDQREAQTQPSETPRDR